MRKDNAMEPKSKLKPYHGLIGLALVFLILLFVSIIQQIVSFVDLLWTEMTMRM